MNRTLDTLLLRYLGYAVLFGGALLLLYLVRGALPVFFVAGLLAYAFEPLLRRLERGGRSRSGAVGYVFLIFGLVFLLFLALLASAWQQAQSLATNAGAYQGQIQAVVENAQHKLADSRLPRDVKQSISEGITQFQGRALREAPARLQSAVGWMLGSVGQIAILLVVLPIVTLWLMIEANPLRARLLMIVPPVYRQDVTLLSGEINELLGRYVRGQMIVCGLFGLLCLIAFSILSHSYGMSYPLVLGLLAGLLYILPYVGMATIASTAGLTAYFTSSAPVTCALLAVGCCIVFNLIIDYGIAPRVLGRGVGLHPLMIIFALLSGAQLGGVFGMILAVPFFASLRVVAVYLFPQLTAPIPQTSVESRIGATGSKAAAEAVRETAQAEREA